MKTRRQEGYLFKEAGYWYVRFYQGEVGADGKITRRQRAVRLAEVCKDYRSKESVRPLRDELFYKLRLNSPRYNLESTMTISQFVTQHFFASHVPKLKPSVHAPYECNWRLHLQPLCGQMRLRDFRTSDGQAVIDELAKHKLGRNAVRRCKSLLSGMFSEAIRLGFLDSGNPVREVRIPALPEPADTRYYTLEETTTMLRTFIGPAKAIIAVFAYTGLRKGEVAALRCESWRDGALWVERSCWRGGFTEPKSRKSKAPVPVIAPLARILQEHLAGRTEGLIFPSRKGTPLNLDNFATRKVRPVVERLKLSWYGWHAFRRGLGTNLNQLGVEPKDIQAILRHSDFETTMNQYVKSVPKSARKAMESLESLICSQYAVNSPISDDRNAQVV